MISPLGNIDVLILTGGKGTRLSPVVKDRPKTMVEINHSPLLVNHIDYLSGQGFSRFILCTGYKGNYIKHYFENYPSKHEIILSHEKKPLGTGGAVWHAQTLIRSDPFIVLNGDSFCEVDYNHFLSYHYTKTADATIAVKEVNNRKDYGSIVFDNKHRITGFFEKDEESQTHCANAGVYCFSMHIINTMPQNKPFSLELNYFPSILKRKIFAYITEKPFFDIGTPERLQRYINLTK